MRNFKFVLLSTIFSNFVLAGYYTSNQTILTKEQYQIANPKVNKKVISPKSENDLVVAIIGLGVDYTLDTIAPRLFITKDGRIGKDYIGKDNFPAPYIINNNINDSDLKNFYSENFVKVAEFSRQKTRETILKHLPTFSNILSYHRDTKYEIGNLAFHETQIASLYVEHTDVKILSYRVLPFTYIFSDKGYELLRGEVLYRLRFLESIKQAIRDGADIINISHGFDLKKSFLDDEDEYKAFKGELGKIIESSKNVLFIASAGNGINLKGQLVNDKSLEKEMLPCTYNYKNVLCVGSLSKLGAKSVFSNYSDTKKEFKYELGEELIVKNPRGMCDSMDLFKVMGFNFKAMDKALANKSHLSLKIVENCSDRSVVDGTSYSTVFAVKKIEQIKKKNNLTLMKAYKEYLDLRNKKPVDNSNRDD